MIDILRIPDDCIILTDKDRDFNLERGISVENIKNKQSKNNDANVRFEMIDRKLNVYLTALNSAPLFVCLRWNYSTEEAVRVMGDKWERAYGDLSWHSINSDELMPWYFFVSNNYGETTGCGVMVQPNSFVSFEYDSSGVTAWFDVRNGSEGVQLNGRELLIGTVVCEHYKGISSFEAAVEFCKVMSPKPILPNEPVYGGNNWYYAYGNSSGKEIHSDAEFIAALSENNENRPFMVIDDGWQPIPISGPWVGNDRYGDMALIADDFKKIGVKPGVWIRLLHDEEKIKSNPDWLLPEKKEGRITLDPSHPEVKEYLRDTIKRIKDWGYMLLKHDYSTSDLFGDYGYDLNGLITVVENWSFYDRTKTNAEIVLDFYRLIRETAGDMLVLGCNTISHLCAGLVEINRIGDDTSGKYWSRTRILGVNSLAFRLPQNKSFYMVDADCVGILDNNIPWELNAQWMELLAKSGTPLFLSCQNGALTYEQLERTKELFEIASEQKDIAIPVDWEYNTAPHIWNINGEIIKFDWIKNTYPVLLKRNTQPM